MSSETTRDPGTAKPSDAEIQADLDRVKKEFSGDHDVFISFSALDLEAVNTITKALSRGLEPMGMRAWNCLKGIVPGAVWLKILIKKIGRARCFVLLLSEQSLGSEWVTSELQAAVERHHESIKRGDEEVCPKIYCFRLDRVATRDTSFELLLNSFQKVNENVHDWHDDVDNLVEAVCDALGVPRPPPLNPWKRLSNKLKRQAKRGAATLVRVGIPLVSLVFLLSIGLLGTLVYFASPLVSPLVFPPHAPDLLAADDDGASDSDNITTNIHPRFVLNDSRPGIQLQLLRDGNTIVGETTTAEGQTAVMIDDERLAPFPQESRHRYSARYVNFLGIHGRESPSLDVTIKPKVEIPRPGPRTDGVVEISRSAVRCFGVRLIEQGAGRYVIAPKASLPEAEREPVRQEKNVKLVFRPESGAFESNTVDAVAQAVGSMTNLLTDQKIPRDHIWIVISSGVRFQAIDPRFPANDPRFRDKNKQLQKRGMEDLIRRLKVAFGENSKLKIEEIRPVDEAGYLIKEVLRRNELARSEHRKDIPLVQGDVIAIDVGSGNVKIAYYDPGDDWVGPFNLEHVAGITEDMPGTRSLTEATFGEGYQLRVDERDDEKKRKEKREDCLEQLKKKADSELGRILARGIEDTPMLGSSQSVILAGGASWAMCRVARPEDDPTEWFTVLQGHSRNIAEFQIQLLGKGLDALKTPHPASHPLAQSHQRELDKVRKAFTLPQLLSAGVILGTVDQKLLNVAKDRQVYFITDSMFDWLAAYLVEKANQDRAGQGAITPGVR